MKTLLPLILTSAILVGCNQANVQPSTASNAPSENAPAVVSDAQLVAMAYNIRYDNGATEPMRGPSAQTKSPR